MITYKASDVKFSWDHTHLAPGEVGPKTCGYIKEGAELEETDESDEKNNESYYWSSATHREKRQIDQYKYTPTKTRCPLLLVADYRFFQEMGGSNIKTTINYLVYKNKVKIFFCFSIIYIYIIIYLYIIK